jgi:hypothetical protein
MMLADCIAFVSIPPRKGRAPIKSFDARLEFDEATGCWNWTGAIDQYGYGNVKRVGKNFRAHRLAYEKLVGPIPNGAFILHSCDNPACCNPDHLRPGSQKDNIRDAIKRGRFVAPRQKLTLAQVDEIRKSLASNRELGECFGVHHTTIRDVRSGRTFASKSVNYERGK